MPRISEFYGIVISIYYNDHPWPHFHARYAGRTAWVLIATGEVIKGELPRPQQRFVRKWAKARRAELQAAWHSAETRQTPVAIEPLP